MADPNAPKSAGGADASAKPPSREGPVEPPAQPVDPHAPDDFAERLQRGGHVVMYPSILTRNLT